MLQNYAIEGYVRVELEPEMSALSPAIMNLLVNKYKAAGWNDVRMKSDQRDGDWLEFVYNEPLVGLDNKVVDAYFVKA
jgi:hypothetical protein